MKNASPAALSILATGQYVIAQLYDITLATGQVYHYTDFQIPLSAAIYPSGTPNSYLTGLTITRDSVTQKAGLEAGSTKLTLAPQLDSPNAPILIAGYPLVQAARYGFLDSATVALSMLVMNLPTYTGNMLDTSPGGTLFFVGTAMEIDPGRFACDVTVDDYLAGMSTKQMPRNVWRTGCSHSVYDAGCSLLQSLFTVSGTISTVGDAAHFTTNLTQADHYFELGVITFTSGVNNGLSQTVGSYLHASGALSTKFPFAAAPSVGDTFSIYPGDDLQQATCTTKFNNLAHFGGTPYVPVPETLLDGGTDNPPLQATGGQAGQIIGSSPAGKINLPPYKT